MKTKTSKKNIQGGGGYVNFPCHIDSGHSIIMPLYYHTDDPYSKQLEYPFINHNYSQSDMGISATCAYIRVLSYKIKRKEAIYLMELSGKPIKGAVKIIEENSCYVAKGYLSMCQEAVIDYMINGLNFNHADACDFLKPVMYRRIIRFEGYPK